MVDLSMAMFNSQMVAYFVMIFPKKIPGLKPPLHGRELLEEMLEARILTYVRQRALLEMYAGGGYDTIEPTFWFS
jgi:hypothetical protein